MNLDDPQAVRSGAPETEPAIVGSRYDLTVEDTGFSVADFPTFQHSNKAVKRAGKALKGDLFLTPEQRAETLRIFAVAHDWRGSHVFPMDSIKRSIEARIRQCGLDGIMVARLKTMPSIRKKLNRHEGGLDQMQDLGGIRAIMPTFDDAMVLFESIKEKNRHDLDRENNYI